MKKSTFLGLAAAFAMSAGFVAYAVDEDPAPGLPLGDMPEYVLTPESGSIVESFSDLKISFPENLVSFAEPEDGSFEPVLKAILANETTDVTYYCYDVFGESSFNEEEATGQWTLFNKFIFVDEDGDEVFNYAPGVYQLTVQNLEVYNDSFEPVYAIAPIQATYIIEYPAPYMLTPASGETVQNLQGITIYFPEDIVSIVENARPAVAMLQNLTTGTVYVCAEPDFNDRTMGGSSYTFMFQNEDAEEGEEVPAVIDEMGQYVLSIRGLYVGDDQVEGELPVITANYTVSVEYLITPAAGEVVTDLQTVSIVFPMAVAFVDGDTARLTNESTGTVYTASAYHNTNSMIGYEYTFTFVEQGEEESAPIEEPGYYVLTISGMSLANDGEDEEDAELVVIPNIVVNYTIEAPYTITPAAGQVADLSLVTVDFTTMNNVKFYPGRTVATLVNETTDVTYYCMEPDRNTFAATEGTEYSFRFFANGEYDEEGNPVAATITEPGNYTLTIRGAYQAVEEDGEEVDTIDLPVITVAYSIPAPYVITPAAGEVESITDVTINFPETVVMFYDNTYPAAATLVNLSSGETYYGEGTAEMPGVDETTGVQNSGYRFVFYNNPAPASTEDADEVPSREVVTITEPGEYELTLRGMYTMELDENGDESEPMDLPNITVNYTIQLPYELTPANGSVLDEITSVKLDFTTTKNVEFYTGRVVATLVNETTGTTYNCMEPDRNTFAETADGIEYEFYFSSNGEFDEDGMPIVAPITEPGNYTLSIRGAYMPGVDEDGNVDLPVIVANYSINVPYVLDPAAGEVESLSVINIEFPETVVMFYDNTRPATVMLENISTETIYYGEATQDWIGVDENTGAMGTAYRILFYETPVAFDGEDREAVEITEPGNYQLTLRGMYTQVLDEDGEPSEDMILPNIVVDYIITIPYTMTPENGSTVETLEAVFIDFTDNKNVAFYENSTMPVAVITNGLLGDNEVSYTCREPERMTFAESTGAVYQFIFLNENDEPVVIEEDGTWYLTVRAFGLTDGETNEIVTDLPEIHAEFIVSTNTGISNIISSDVYNVYGINGVQMIKNGKADDLKSLNPGLYIINGKKVIIRK